jgi:hypothetical protein
MSIEDFKGCARHTLGDVVDSWDEVVIRPLIELGEWFKSQNDTVKWIFGALATGTGGSLIAWIARVVGATAAEVVAPVVLAFGVGVGVGSGLLVVAECAGSL